MDQTAEVFQQILEAARKDANILAFWLDGSRGKDLITPSSDYDCTMIVKDEVFEEYRHIYEDVGVPEIELSVLTLNAFRQYAAWGSDNAWQRYNFAHLKALVDKTGKVQQLIDEKGTLPPDEIPRFINQALDHYINQVYRSVKCARDGQSLGTRLEAAEGINPLLDAIFALNCRLRPYFKYIEWELENYPLLKLGLDPQDFLNVLLEILTSANVKSQQRLFSKMETLFRAEGYGAVFDEWREKLLWIKEYSSILN